MGGGGDSFGWDSELVDIGCKRVNQKREHRQLLGRDIF